MKTSTVLHVPFLILNYPIISLLQPSVLSFPVCCGVQPFEVMPVLMPQQFQQQGGEHHLHFLVLFRHDIRSKRVL